MEKQDGITDEDLSNLSDDERAALDDEGSGDEAALREIAGGDDTVAGAGDDTVTGAGADEGEDEDDGEDTVAGAGEDTAAGAAANDTVAGAGADTIEGAAAGEDDEDEPAPLMPVYRAPPVEKFDEKMAGFDTEDAALTAKFKGGELELEDLLKGQREIEAKRGALRESKLKHDISVEQEQQAQAAAWQFDVDTFMRKAKRDDGVDYRGSPVLNAAFDQAVKALAAKDENADRTGRWFLREAHKQVMAAFNRGAPAQGADGNAGGKPAAQRKPNLRVVPKTIGGLPEAEQAGAGDEGEFSHLEGLEGQDYEDAIARLSPAQQDRYARGK